MQQEIRQWLAGGQDYTEGVKLYEQYGSSNVLKRMFASGTNSFNREKLLKSLVELLPAEAPEPKPAAAKPKQSTPKVSAKAAEVIPAPQPDDALLYKQLMQQREQLLDERTLTHSRLDMVKTDAERLELALRIHALVPQIKKLNHIRKFYLEHLVLPEGIRPKTKVDESDKASLLQRRNNLRTYCSRYKNNPDKAKELETHREEIERLTILINSK